MSSGISYWSQAQLRAYLLSGMYYTSFQQTLLPDEEVLNASSRTDSYFVFLAHVNLLSLELSIDLSFDLVNIYLSGQSILMFSLTVVNTCLVFVYFPLLLIFLKAFIYSFKVKLAERASFVLEEVDVGDLLPLSIKIYECKFMEKEISSTGI